MKGRLVILFSVIGGFCMLFFELFDYTPLSYRDCWTNWKEQLLFFFVPCRKRNVENKTLSPVSLILARTENSSYRILDSEPISLREIGYSDGELIFFHSSGEIKTSEVRMTLKKMVADVIRSYFVIESDQPNTFCCNLQLNLTNIEHLN